LRRRYRKFLVRGGGFSGKGINPAVERPPGALAILKKTPYLSRDSMLPDYPHKIFDDKRLHYFLLMEALAMDAGE
jgi:hypothetical protein